MEWTIYTSRNTYGSTWTPITIEPYHNRPIRRGVANSTPISTLSQVLDFSKILDKNFWSRVKLDCCFQDSILCTSGYMEISGICIFGFVNFRVYELSGIWIFGIINFRAYEFSGLSYPTSKLSNHKFCKKDQDANDWRKRGAWDTPDAYRVMVNSIQGSGS